MAAAEANKIIEKNVSPILYNPELGFNDVIPYNLLHSKFATYSTENPLIFKDLSQLFTSFPNTLYNFFLNNDIFNTVINTDIIYNYTRYQEGREQMLDVNYDVNYTVYKCNDMFVFDETNPNPNLGTEIEKFMESDKRLFVGFIKIGTSWKKLLSYTSILSGVKIAGHMNSFIIDKERNRIIHFEPKGAFAWVSIWCSLSLVDYLVNSVKSPRNKETLRHMEFIHSGILLKSTIMPQYFDIYCQTYSQCALLLYCLNPNFEDPLLLFQTLSQQKAIIFQNYFYYHYRKILNKTFSLDSNLIPEIMRSLKLRDEQLIQDVSRDLLRLKLSSANSNNNFTQITKMKTNHTKGKVKPISRTNKSVKPVTEKKSKQNKKGNKPTVKKKNSNNNSFEIL
jgi:hypothetical protein